MKRHFLKSKLAAVQRRWMPIVEALESRAVLSVCGVTCDLMDGMLNVQGTPSDDLIAVRYDAEAASVSVLGRDNELIGQFPLADVRGLNIDGLGGNDDLHVDSPLHQTLAVNGAEGESSSGSASNVGGHSHGASIPSSSKAASNSNVNYGPVLSQSLMPAITSPNMESETASAPSSAGLSLATTTTSTASHVSHGSGGVELGLTSHVHGSTLAGAMVSAVAGVVNLQNHGHSVGYRPTTPGAEGGLSQQGVSAVEESNGELELAGHDKHSDTATTTISTTKLVPKPCTVSYSGGLVVTSVDGNRQCSCEQKKQAAEEIKQQLSGKNDVADGLVAALAECVPCQSGGLFGLPSEFQTCSTPSAWDGLPLAMLEEHHAGSACPSRLAGEDAEASAAVWLESLQYVGWPLVVASVALVPALWERRRNNEDETEDVAAPATDWLFGRFQAELLLAR